MCAKAAVIRRRLPQDDPATDRADGPTALVCDLRSQAAVSIDGADQPLHVDELGLQLDYQERTRRWMHRQDVHDAALAINREGRLRSHQPSTVAKLLRDRLVHGGMTRPDHAVELAAAPSRDQVDPDVERRGDAT